MSDKGPEYYQMWADRLNSLSADDPNAAVFTPDWVMDAERRSGKDIGEMTEEDHRNAMTQRDAEAAELRADADDLRLLAAGMKRHKAQTPNHLFATLSPDADDYRELHDAFERIVARAEAMA